MAPEARSRKNTKKPIVDEPRGWLSVRELWDLASRAEIDLERAGKPVTPEVLWARIKPEAPAAYRFEDKMPADIKAMLAHAGYAQLLDIRKRMVVLPVLKEYGLLQDLTSQMSYLALASIMEDLMLHPETIPVNERRQLAKTFLDVSLQLKGLSPAEEEKAVGSLSDIASEEQRDRDSALSAIPEAYRELMGKKWDEERLKSLRTRQALHTIETNKMSGHGKAV